MLRYDGRVAIVTGAGRGVGRATAILLASRGASVVVNDLPGDASASSARSAADDVVAEIVAAGGRAVANYASVSSESGPREIVKAALDAFGRIDALVNNAGNERSVAFQDCTLEDLRSPMEVHYFGTAGVTLAAWPHLVASGAGRVVNTTSDATFGMVTRVGYSAAKAAIMAFTRSLALEAAAHGIKVNSIAPRAYTRMAAESNVPEATKAYMKANLAPEHVASLTGLLAHESCPVSGKAFAVGGGAAYEIGMTLNAGFKSIEFTPETILANIATLTDRASIQFQEKTFIAT
jgi:NAD(P)-dependent dehydrogenase (short-subunit alcohol dehydrogenase family)